MILFLFYILKHPLFDTEVQILAKIYADNSDTLSLPLYVKIALVLCSYVGREWFIKMIWKDDMILKQWTDIRTIWKCSQNLLWELMFSYYFVY